MRKKIGTIGNVFNLKSDISHYILMGVFEKVVAGSNDTNSSELQDFFKIKLSQERSSIMIQSLGDNRLKISLGEFKKSKSADIKFSGAIISKDQFVINYDTLDVFNSEY